MRNIFTLGTLAILAFGLHSSVQAQKPTAEIELFASLDQAVGNIAFTKDGQLVLSHHPFFKPDIRVGLYDEASKQVTSFPNKAWNTPRTENDWYLDDVLGLRNDANGIIWMLDMGTRNNITPKLVAWDTNKNELHRLLYMPAPASNETSQLNDFVIDSQRQLIVIADEGIARGGDGSKAALVVVNLQNGKTRRILEGHNTTKADRNHPIMIDGKPMSVINDGKRTPIFVGADGITLDEKNEWLYYAPLNGKSIYRVRMDDIANESISEVALGAKIETYSTKVNNGGLSIDTQGNLYFTNVESRSIGFVATGDKSYSVLTQDERMLWPDGISSNKDGYMYVSAAQVQLGAPFNNGTDKTSAPFYIFRFKPLSKGIFGR